MKKLLVIILSALAVTLNTVCYGQTGFVFADGVAVLSTEDDKVSEIIAYYANMPGASRTQIDSIIHANPFLKQSDFLKQYMAKKKALDTVRVGAATGAASGLFGLNVTNFADGLAKFLIERGKQELSMAFFDKMKEEFKKYPELITLFPNTFEILDEIQNHNILTLLQELRDAFAKDLLNGPSNVLALRQLDTLRCDNLDGAQLEDCKNRNEKHNKRIKDIRKAAGTRTAAVSLLIAQGMLNGNNIISILGTVATDTTFCEGKANSGKDDLGGYLKLTYVVMDMLRTSKTGLFISEVQLKELFSNKELLTIFLGLGYQKFNVTDCFKPEQLKIGTSTLETIFQTLLSESSKFHGMLGSLDNVNFAYSAIVGQLSNGQPTEPSSYGSLVSGSTFAVERIVNALSVVLRSPSPDELRKVLANLDITMDLAIDIQQRNYTGIFNDIIRFVDANNILGNNAVAKAKLVKYLSFGANLASAQNSDEVKDALNAATLPPGSFSVKQKSKFSIGLNAYVGYAWDFNGGLYGRNVYAPFGIASSWGINKGNGGAVSLFVSIIDVGSLVAYRLNNSATDTLKQEVRLESIISPSAQVIYALPRLPVSICAGVRRTPKLVFEGQTEFRVVTPETVLNLSILIDIPLFNIKVTPYD
jgi:hypothetical protein